MRVDWLAYRSTQCLPCKPGAQQWLEPTYPFGRRGGSASPPQQLCHCSAIPVLAEPPESQQISAGQELSLLLHERLSLINSSQLRETYFSFTPGSVKLQQVQVPFSPQHILGPLDWKNNQVSHCMNCLNVGQQHGYKQPPSQMQDSRQVLVKHQNQVK